MVKFDLNSNKIFIHPIWYTLETFFIIFILIFLFVFLTQPLVGMIGVAGAAVVILLIVSAIALSIIALLKQFYLKGSYLICEGENLQNYRRGKLLWSVPIQNIVAADERQGLWEVYGAGGTNAPSILRFVGFSLSTTDNKHYYGPYLKNYDLFLQEIKQLNPNIILTNLASKIVKESDWWSREIKITKKQIFIAIIILLGVVILFNIITKI